MSLLLAVAAGLAAAAGDALRYEQLWAAESGDWGPVVAAHAGNGGQVVVLHLADGVAVLRLSWVVGEDGNGTALAVVPQVIRIPGITAVCVSSEAKTMAIGTEAGNLLVYDLPDQAKAQLSAPPHSIATPDRIGIERMGWSGPVVSKGAISDVSITADGQVIAVAHDWYVLLYLAADLAVPPTVIRAEDERDKYAGVPATVLSVNLGPGGRDVLVKTTYNTVRRYPLQPLEEWREVTGSGCDWESGHFVEFVDYRVASKEILQESECRVLCQSAQRYDCTGVQWEEKWDPEVERTCVLWIGGSCNPESRRFRGESMHSTVAGHLEHREPPLLVGLAQPDLTVACNPLDPDNLCTAPDTPAMTVQPLVTYTAVRFPGDDAVQGTMELASANVGGEYLVYTAKVRPPRDVSSRLASTVLTEPTRILGYAASSRGPRIAYITSPATGAFAVTAHSTADEAGEVIFSASTGFSFAKTDAGVAPTAAAPAAARRAAVSQGQSASDAEGTPEKGGRTSSFDTDVQGASNTQSAFETENKLHPSAYDTEKSLEQGAPNSENRLHRQEASNTQSALNTENTLGQGASNTENRLHQSASNTEKSLHQGAPNTEYGLHRQGASNTENRLHQGAHGAPNAENKLHQHRRQGAHSTSIEQADGRTAAAQSAGVECRTLNPCGSSSYPTPCGLPTDWKLDEADGCAAAGEVCTAPLQAPQPGRVNQMPFHLYCMPKRQRLSAGEPCMPNGIDMSDLCEDGLTCALDEVAGAGAVCQEKGAVPTVSAKLGMSSTGDLMVIVVSDDGGATNWVRIVGTQTVLSPRVVPVKAKGPCTAESSSLRDRHHECRDGHFCEAVGCCEAHWGIMRCPPATPSLCASTNCGSGRSHCCAADCSSLGGVLPCAPCGNPQRKNPERTVGLTYELSSNNMCPSGRIPIVTEEDCAAAAAVFVEEAKCAGSASFFFANATAEPGRDNSLPPCYLTAANIVTYNPAGTQAPWRYDEHYPAPKPDIRLLCKASDYIVLYDENVPCPATFVKYKRAKYTELCKDAYTEILASGYWVSQDLFWDTDVDGGEGLDCYMSDSVMQFNFATTQKPGRYNSVCMNRRYTPSIPEPPSSRPHLFYPGTLVYAVMFGSIGLCFIAVAAYWYKTWRDRRRQEALVEHPLEQGLIAAHKESYEALLERVVIELDPDATIEQCSVCLEDLINDRVVQLPDCGHRIHLPCMQQYLTHLIEKKRTKNPRCPICRTKILLEQPAGKSPNSFEMRRMSVSPSSRAASPRASPAASPAALPAAAPSEAEQMLLGGSVSASSDQAAAAPPTPPAAAPLTPLGEPSSRSQADIDEDSAPLLDSAPPPAAVEALHSDSVQPDDADEPAVVVDDPEYELAE
ncbi:hypothetical protein DIPPA_26212 [Diplonema papillatum]|nr:hypothetical protein DIPPA_26212 [Diplonema papillatum]